MKKRKVLVGYNVNYSIELELEIPDNFTFIDNSEEGFEDLIDINSKILDNIEIPENELSKYNEGSFEITHVSK